MRRAVLLVMVVAALTAAGCSGEGGKASGEASCSGLVVYDGRDYLPTGKSVFTVGERLGTATVAACYDTPREPGTGVAEATTGVYAVEGADPTEAVAVGDDRAGAAHMTAR
ncbi:DUF6281 family protein [Streptomyces sp. NPDC046859]|uniref:DUF6281 family protein n=1 Tax=Streptomyces sp. NPDC046859 TaxID=3155734 RepID=UPI0033E8407B